MRDENLAVGQTPPRPDGKMKVNGQALYVDDLKYDDMWHGVTVRCPHAHARIKSINTDALKQLPQAVVLTAKDLRGPNIVKLIIDDQPILVDEFVRHAYEAVALVAAPSRKLALEAAALVNVDYEVLNPAITIDEALAQGEDSHLEAVLSDIRIQNGDVTAGFEEADFIIEGTYSVGHQEHIYIEPQGIIAEAKGDGFEIVGSMQCPYYIHTALTFHFQLSEEQVVVKQSTTGGGFGGKEDYPNLIAIHAALLARACKHPTKIIYERSEDIHATTKRHPARIHHKTGIKKDGTLVAVEVDALFDGGAYVTLSSVVNSRGLLHAAGAYRCQNVSLRGRVLATHTAPNGAFRGFGAPQTLFAAERHMDKIARTLAMHPLDLRLKNAYQLGDVTPTGQVLTESVSALECLEKAAKKSNYREKWSKYEAERLARIHEDGPIDEKAWNGIGLALYFHGAGFTGNGENRMMSEAALQLLPGGKVEILTASTDIGQGTTIVFAQMVADGVGIKAEHVQYGTQDTSKVPNSGPTVASRTVMIVGGILARCGRKLAGVLEEFVATRHGLSADQVHLSRDHFHGPKGVDLGGFTSAADAYLREVGPLHLLETYEAHGRFFDEKTYRGDAYPCFAWGCDIMEVSVDPDTLIMTPDTITVACDVGKAIHPVLCRGQLEGGTLQAVAYGYLEEMKQVDGRFQNDRLTNYLIPTSKDCPKMDIIIVENPYSGGPFGAKGIGELPMDGGAPAVVAALENATGIQASQLPATPERLWQDLKDHHVVTGAPSYMTDGMADP